MDPVRFEPTTERISSYIQYGTVFYLVVYEIQNRNIHSTAESCLITDEIHLVFSFSTNLRSESTGFSPAEPRLYAPGQVSK